MNDRYGLPMINIVTLSKRLVQAVCLLLLCCLCVPTASACEYTVRDVGFTDLGDSLYRLYYYIGEDTPSELSETFRQVATAAFLDTNVGYRIVEVERQQDELAMRYFRFWEPEVLPCAILVAPNETSIRIPVPNLADSARDATWDALESIVSSPATKRFLEHAVQAYCSILLVESNNAAENNVVREKVAKAISQFENIIPQMPKVIDEPPKLLTLSAEQTEQEHVLLWSLGINVSELDGPMLAVLYGRGRRMGPPLTKDDIQEGKLFNLLSIVGASCECGLDRSWLLGSICPMRWDSTMQSGVVKHLGFDAENPLVKLEMSRILSLSSSEDGFGTTVPSTEGVLGYSEQTVAFDAAPTTAMVSPAQLRAMANTDDESNHSGTPGRAIWLTVGGITLLVGIVGVLMMVARRRED